MFFGVDLVVWDLFISFDDFDIGCLIWVRIYDFQIWVLFLGFYLRVAFWYLCDEIIVY